MPPRSEFGKRARPLRPVGIAQDIHCVDLNQHSRMADKRDPELAASHALARGLTACSVGPLPPRPRLASCKPSQQIDEANFRPHLRGIVKAPAIEMV